MYYILFICSPADRHWSCFHVSAIRDTAAVNVGVNISLHLYRNRYSSPVFHYLTNTCTVFHSGSTNFHSHNSD